MELIEDLDAEEARAIVDPALKIQPPDDVRMSSLPKRGTTKRGPS
jgi:hypothetical protein